MKIWILVLIVCSAMVAGCTVTATTPKAGPSINSTSIVISTTQPMTVPATAAVPTGVVSTSVSTSSSSAPTPPPVATAASGSVQNNVTLDKVTVSMQGTRPAQPILQLHGSLPTPCDKLQVNISQPDANNQIQVKVYSQSNPNLMCAQVLTPFTQIEPIKNLSSGNYTVWVNGKQSGSIDIP